MPTSTSRSKASLEKKVAFEYYAPQAAKVGLAGTFNQWNAEAALMTKGANGNWKIIVSLRPGRYQYRYYVDGMWQNDPNPVECVPNPFGSWDCVIVVR